MTDKADFLDGIDEKAILQDLFKETNRLYAHIDHMLKYRYNLLLYRLIRKGYVKIDNLVKASGHSKQRIYQLITEFERKEIDRING